MTTLAQIQISPRVHSETQKASDEFGDVIDKARKQLNTPSKTLGTVGTRTRARQRQWKHVEAMPEEAAQKLLAIPEIPEEDDTGDD